MIAVGFLVLQLVGYLFVWKAIIYRALLARIHDLARAEADNAHAVGRVGNELQGLRKTLKSTVHTEMEPLMGELEVIGSLIKQLAENSTDLENRIIDLEAMPAVIPDTLSKAASKPAEKAKAAPPTPQITANETAASPRTLPENEDTDDILAEISIDSETTAPPIMKAVQNAIQKNNVDLYLQPIVSLPQRKPKFYEALTRIRTEDGDLIRPAQFIKHAEQSGTMPILDKMLLIRVIQVLRRLLTRKADAVIVCNISASSLADSSFFNDFKKLLKTKANLIDHLIFEFDQNTIENLDTLEEESLRALKGLGFHFAIDNVTNLSMNFRRLVELGFHYVKVSAEVLLAAKENGLNDIHAEDIPRYLSRNGIQLIVDHIETEGQVVELLDFDIRLGQGFLFAAPREVKPDIASNPQRRETDTKLAS